ncbi:MULTISPECIES: hypothetical protein [Halomonas]|uniref:Uncharacterized protein n=1 Tax=Halomonas citrativorans TaxID=2742612 RepID=A0A1R4HSP3_9GAMM|nr:MULTISPECIES: hypothetical protein [Halomonas]MBE0405088.1 hypothetical protein [Halomonas citrativorans]SJN10591.1 hypothetical protein CZ787_04050 [Halomonas citrativorans]HCR97350.1 hypothetical protein [Halomonas sp.]
MSIVHVSEAELYAKLEKCMSGERVLIDQAGNRFSARIQLARKMDATVIPEKQLHKSHDDPDEVDSITVPYEHIWELEIKGVVYSRLAE